MKTPQKSEPSKHQPDATKSKFPEPVPVPDAPTAELPESHLKQMQKENAFKCQALDECLAQYSGKGKDEALKTCVIKHLGEEKGEKVWSIYSKAKIPATKKVSLASLRALQPQSYFKVLGVLSEALGQKAALLQTDFCLVANYNVFGNHDPKAAETEKTVTGVPVPEPTDVELPMPGRNHPNYTAGENAVDTPANCQKLDTCLSKLPEDKYEEGFKKCVSKFCEESYKSKDFKEEDDPRTQLCDKKGRDAWDLLAKAGADVKKSASLLGMPKATSTLLSMAVHDSNIYHRIMKSVFPKDATLVEMQHKCRL